MYLKETWRRPGLKSSATLNWLLVIVSLSIFSFLWFEPLPYHTLSGDDIILLKDANTGVYATSFWDSWGQTHVGKYRPVFSVIFSVLVRLFVEDYRAYFNVNLVLQLANGVLLAYISWLLSRRRWPVAVITGLMFLFSRFSYHYVLQLWGLMEELALFFLLMIIYTLRRAYLKKQPRALLWPVFFFFLCTFTHERYMLLVGFLSLAILVMPASFPSLKSRLFWTSLPVGVIAFNFLVKTLFIQTGFTDGRPLETNLLAVLAQVGTGFANILSFSMGKHYLTGIDITETGLTGYLLGLGCAIPVMLLSLIYARYVFSLAWGEKLKTEVIKIGLFLVLIGTLLVSASIAVQQELRWLYSAYTVLLLGIAYLAGVIVNLKKTGYLLLAWVGLGAFCADVYYRGYIDNIYICANMNYTDMAKAAIIDKYGPELSKIDLFIIHSGNETLGNWVFLDEYWFQLYSKLPGLKVNFIDGANDIPPEVIQRNKFLVFFIGPKELYSGPGVFKDVTQQTRQFLMDRHPGKVGRQEYLNLIKEFPNGKINSNLKATTPTGQGALLLKYTIPFATDLGATSSLTILSSYNYRYEDLKIKPNSYLSFYAAKIYDIGDSATLYIDSKDEQGVTRRIYSAELPAAEKGSLKWQFFEVPLTKNLPENLTLSFGVESPTGNSNADWVGLNYLFISS